MWVLSCSVYQEENWESALTGVGKDPRWKKSGGLSCLLCSAEKNRKIWKPLLRRKGNQKARGVLYPDISGLKMEVARWLLSGLGHATDQTICKTARQALSPISWPSPPNPTPGIAPCGDRCCCSLQEERRGHRAVTGQGPQKSRSTSETHNVSPPGLVKATEKLRKQIEMLGVFLSLQNSNEYIL